MIDMRILVIDDETHIRKTTAMTLDALGHDCVQAATGAEALALLQKSSFDAAFLDLRLGTENGLDLIPKMLALEPKLAVIVFTAYSSIDTAVEAMRRGAVDYIAKPFTPEQMRRSLSRIENARRLENASSNSNRVVSDSQALADFNSEEPAMQKLFETANKAAATAATMLLLGESGTGKSVLARAMHGNSPAADNAFVTVSLSQPLPGVAGERTLRPCARRLHRRGGRHVGKGRGGGGRHAFPGRNWRAADGNSAQAAAAAAGARIRARRRRQARKANVRVIAATNRKLEELRQGGQVPRGPVTTG